MIKTFVTRSGFQVRLICEDFKDGFKELKKLVLQMFADGFDQKSEKSFVGKKLTEFSRAVGVTSSTRIVIDRDDEIDIQTTSEIKVEIEGDKPKDPLLEALMAAPVHEALERGLEQNRDNFEMFKSNLDEELSNTIDFNFYLLDCKCVD